MRPHVDLHERITRGRFLALAGTGLAWLYAPAARAGVPADSANVAVRAFVSRRDLEPPVVAVTTSSPAATGGCVFLTPASGPSQRGPLIVDSSGEPVWFRPLTDAVAHDLRVQRLDGRPVLTWWEGTYAHGYGQGEYVVVDSSYAEVARISAANGYAGDLHECTLTSRGSALISVYNSVPADLSAYGGPTDGTLLEGVVQEIDVATGELLFEWRSSEHVGVDESYLPSPGGLWDYFHLNSIDELADGNLLISARHTSAVYKLDRSTGAILWRLGGKRSDFRMGDGTAFAYQHDARGHPGDLVSIFDDGAYSPASAIEPASRAIVLALDTEAMTADLQRVYVQPEGKLTVAMGNNQLLPGGGAFVGWGTVPECSEFSASGEVVFEANLPGGGVSYRAYRDAWKGAGPGRPALAAVRAGHGVNLYASWNGATEVAAWRVSGGATARTAQEIRTVPRTGFETHVHLVHAPTVVAVTALDAHGRTLGSSRTIRV